MWQPIETAPRDGTFIQAKIPGHGSDNIICWCFNLGWAFVYDDQEPPECWTDAVCWAVNEDLRPSVKPTEWKPVT